MHYWDSSALVKLYTLENDSDHFLDLFRESGSALWTSIIASAEILCTLYRKTSDGDLEEHAFTTQYGSFLRDCENRKVMIVKCDDQVITRVQEIVRVALQPPRPAMVRALDAIHIASAISAHATTVVSTDTRFRAVATLAKLKLLP